MPEHGSRRITVAQEAASRGFGFGRPWRRKLTGVRVPARKVLISSRDEARQAALKLIPGCA
jgi:hypothetical protein